MPRTLVTGGTGFVGRFIVEELLDAGQDLVVAGRTAPDADFFSRTLPFRPLTLDPDADFTGLVEGVDFLAHAAFDHVPERYRGGEGDDPEGFRRRNLDGSVALFEAARDAGVKRIVFLSSRAVYGTQPAGAVLSETTEPHPDTLYGATKLAAENHLLAMRSASLVPLVLRVTGVYGPAGPKRRQKWEGLFRDYVAGKEITPRAGTEVHGADVAAAVSLLLQAPPETVDSRVFNVSDLVVDRRDLLAIVKEATGCPHQPPPAAVADGFNVMACSRLRALGWKPGGRALLERTVREMVYELRA